MNPVTPILYDKIVPARHSVVHGAMKSQVARDENLIFPMKSYFVFRR